MEYTTEENTMITRLKHHEKCEVGVVQMPKNNKRHCVHPKKRNIVLFQTTPPDNPGKFRTKKLNSIDLCLLEKFKEHK